MELEELKKLEEKQRIKRAKQYIKQISCPKCIIPRCACSFQTACDITFEEHQSKVLREESLYRHNKKNVLVEPLKIITITFNFALSHTGLDFETILKHYKPTTFLYECKNNSIGKKCKKDPEINNRMYNTLQFSGYLKETKDKLNKTVVRMFHNGSIGISGCRNVRQCIRAIRMIFVFLFSLPESPFIFRKVVEYKNVNCVITLKDRGKKRSFENVNLLIDIDTKTRRIWRIKVTFADCSEEFIHEIKTYQITSGSLNYEGKRINITRRDVNMINPKIGTMNSIFKMNLYQYNLLDIMSEQYSLKDGILNVELTQKETAVKINFVPKRNRTQIKDDSNFVKTRNGHIKYPNQLSMLVYASSVNIAGAKDYKHVFEAYDFITDFVKKHPEIINHNHLIKNVIPKVPYDRELYELFTKVKLLRMKYIDFSDKMKVLLKRGKRKKRKFIVKYIYFKNFMHSLKLANNTQLKLK